MCKFLHVLREACLKKGLGKLPVGTLQRGLGCPARAGEPGAMSASEAAGPVASLSLGHPGRTQAR